MSVINSNPFAGSFGVGASAEYDLGESLPYSAPSVPAGADAILPGPPLRTMPIETPAPGSPFSPPGQPAGAPDFASIMTQLGTAIASLFAQLGNALGGSSSTGSGGAPSAPAKPTCPETYFTSASGASSGDPHLSFSATSATGVQSNKTWDDMASHTDLLDSNSFTGGYRVSTTVTKPGQDGVTLNASAAVTANDGRDRIGFHGDGSYAVTSDGEPVTLETGTPAHLAGGETVTLEADGSLSVADTNANGGSLTTTLRTNERGGVDVANIAQDVNLGGFLVTRSSAQTAAPIAAGAPMVTGLRAYDPEAGDTSLDRITSRW